MTAPFTRIVEPPEREQIDRRRYPRHPTWATARLRWAQGGESEAILTDVTTHGCCLRSEAEWLRAGAFVTLELGEDPRLQAIVRWVRGDLAGLELFREVPPDHAEWHALLNPEDL